MKWTATVSLTVLTQFTADRAHAKIGRIGNVRNRQLQETFYYYPLDITKGVCSDDPATRPSSYTEMGLTLFETREECCNKWYSWQAGENCSKNEVISVSKEAPTTSESDETVFFYPMDLSSRQCSNDVSQRPSGFDSIGFTLFASLVECCATWYGSQDDQIFCVLNPGKPQDPTVPPVNKVGDNGSPPQLFPLGLCQGDCDNDDECAGNLICHQRSRNETVPGCAGGLYLDEPTDFCIDPTVPPVNPEGEGGDGGGGVGGGGDGVVPSVPPVVVVPGDGPVVVVSDPDVVDSGGDPVVVQEEQFYVSNKNCYSTLNANGLVTSGALYSSRFECCNSLEQADRMPCVRSTATTPPNPNPAKSSASQLARGSYVIVAAVCLCFQFM